MSEGIPIFNICHQKFKIRTAHLDGKYTQGVLYVVGQYDFVVVQQHSWCGSGFYEIQ